MTLSRSWLHFTGLLLSLECVNKMERKEPTVLDCCLHLENYRYTVLWATFLHTSLFKTSAIPV